MHLLQKIKWVSYCGSNDKDYIFKNPLLKRICFSSTLGNSFALTIRPMTTDSPYQFQHKMSFWRESHECAVSSADSSRATLPVRCLRNMKWTSPLGMMLKGLEGTNMSLKCCSLLMSFLFTEYVEVKVCTGIQKFIVRKQDHSTDNTQQGLVDRKGLKRVHQKSGSATEGGLKNFLTSSE